MDIIKLVESKFTVLEEIGHQLKLISMDALHLAVRCYELVLVTISFVYSCEPLVNEAEKFLKDFREKVNPKKKGKKK